MSDIDDVLNYHRDKAQLAYQESYLAVDFLINEYGTESVTKILAKVASGINLNQAFLDVIHLDLWDFEDQWFKHIQHKYRWHFLVEFDSYLWVLILALFTIGFILMRRRNRQTLQRWEEEDKII